MPLIQLTQMLRVLQIKIKDQVPIGQVPAQGPMQVVHNVPVQPLPQLVPMQLAPAGNVVPVPQIFYQIG